MAEKILVKKLKNYVVLILDKSGSMTSLKDEVVGGFNHQLKTIKEENEKHGMNSVVSLVTFSTVADEPLVWLKDVNDIAELKPEGYIPNGMTAMYDAVGITIEKLMALPDANDENTAFLIVVISDGNENNSHLYNGEKIAELVSSCEKTGRWTFSYIGANQNLADVSKNLHIHMGNTLVFAASVDGYRGMGETLTSATAGYYKSRAAGHNMVSDMFSPDKNDDDKDDDQDAK